MRRMFNVATSVQEKFTVIYDDDCPLCDKSVGWLVERFGKEKFHLVPCDSGEREKLFPEIKPEECQAAMQLVRTDGKVLSGDAAILEILKSDRRWGPFTLLWKIPVVNVLLAAGYRWVARNRYRISSHLFPSRK
jgi:predicted DCC family thiol-disulfide oxidoreductase YuxK